MVRRILSSQRRVFTLFLATALVITAAFATTGGVAAAAPATKIVVPVPSASLTPSGLQLTNAQQVQEQKLASWLGSIQDGQTASMALPGGYTLTASRVGGQKTITVSTSFHVKLGVTPNERFPFCVAIVSAAIYSFGAAIFGLAAAIGFTIYLPFGVVVSPWLAGVIAGYLAVGAGINGIVGAFLC